MKTLKLVTLTIILFLGYQVQAQTNKETTKRIVEAKRFTFVATSATPANSTEVNSVLRSLPGAMTGANIPLTNSNYDVRITPDSLIAYLPYFGRAYSAPIDPDNNGFKFTSTNFSLDIKNTKRGGWEMTVKPKDTKDGVNMFFSISTNGYANLQISSNTKQGISYSGYLKESKP